MLIRWSIWGPSVRDDLEMLRDSIRSFRKHVGGDASYLVNTDAPDIVRPFLGCMAEVRSYAEYPGFKFGYFGKATWAKWCPAARLAPGDIEIHVDADVFLLKPPGEVTGLIHQVPGDTFLTLSETIGDHWQRGMFASRVDREMPFINAGFFVQGPQADISRALETEYSWWSSHRNPSSETFHDEQGALTMALVHAQRNGRMKMLPKNRYIIVSPRSNPDLVDLSETTLFHATHSGHPAYHRFRQLLE
jgi:hypothetical protein